MGFDPTRRRVARRTDYLFVGAAVVAVIALLMWVLLG
jgi:Na+/melibiose symporter-like transporter